MLLSATRVSVFLPVNTRAEREAAAAVRADIVARYGGLTHSNFRPAAFRGVWRVGNQRFLDEIAILIVDVPSEVSDRTFVADLEDLKRFVHRAYEEAGSPQLEVWLTTTPVGRVSA